MVSAGQETIDFSNLQKIVLTTRSGKVRLAFGKAIPFPPRTTGVLYFHHVPGSFIDSQIRIRLCESVKNFARGSDLVQGSKPWTVLLHRTQPCNSTYQPLLDIIKKEFGVMPSMEHKHNVKTLLPDEMVSTGQRVFDLSGQRTFICNGRVIGSRKRFRYHNSHPFPPNTRGVLYSALENTTLRFRLCGKVEDFHAGSDLLLPNNKPWGHNRNLQDIVLGRYAHGSQTSYSNQISTLVPENIVSSGQNVIHRRRTCSTVVRVPNSGVPGKSKVQLTGFSPKNVSTGVFYYHHVPGDDKKSQLRFRICSTAAKFTDGEDATGGTGLTWNRSLRTMRNATIYKPILDLIREEFGVSDGPAGVCAGRGEQAAVSRQRRSPGLKNPIVTLVPKKILSSGREVINMASVSNVVVGVLNRGASDKPVLHSVQLKYFSPEDMGSGVFYYHHVPGDDRQSQLRFRKCSATAKFREGEDVRGKKGEIWNLSLSLLRRTLSYQPIFNLIRREFRLTGGLTGTRRRSTRSDQEALGDRQRILTLSPQNIVSSGQEIVDIESRGSVSVWVCNRPYSNDTTTRRIQLRGFSPNKTHRGVFYYHHVPSDDLKSQLRFRLCSTIAEFDKGEDAVRPGGTIWKLPLLNLRKSPAYQHIFNLIQEEFGVSKSGPDPSLKLPPIISLSPRKLRRLKQEILDISGVPDILFNSAPARSGRHKCTLVKDPNFASDGVPFPPDTVGVFYYKQSLTSPTYIGELRFRLCRDLAFFNHSEDLAFPTGDPWHIDVQQLYLNEQYRALREILVREGLVKQNPHLADPGNLPRCVQEDNAPVVADVSQPFMLELSREEHAFWLQLGTNNWVLLRIKGLFSPQKQSSNAYMGMFCPVFVTRY